MARQIFNLLAATPTTAPHGSPVPHPIMHLLENIWHQLNLNSLIHNNGWLAWISLITAIFFGLLLGQIASVILRRLAVRLEGGHWHVEALLLDGLANPGKVAIFAVLLGVGFHQLTLSQALTSVSYRIVYLLVDVAAFWYFFNIVSIVEHSLKRLLARHQSNFTEQFVPLVRKTLRLFIFIIGSLYILENVFSQNIGAWLAGMGIAGLAISLAAQDSLKNLFGTLTIFLDQPFLVGNWINYQNYNGMVEAIGLRSTRLRLFDGSAVSIPNSDIVNHAVQNFADRPFIRRTLNISLPYDTPPAKIRQAIQIVQDLCQRPDFKPHLHSPPPPDGRIPRVFFNELGATSLNIVVYYYFYPGTDWWAYLDFNQRFNLALFEAFEKAAIEFAFPTQTLYLAGDPKRQLFLEVPPNSHDHPPPTAP
jgi:MscS family membrane protein